LRLFPAVHRFLEANQDVKVREQIFVASQFPPERLIEDGWQQRVEFGGGSGLQALEVIERACRP
jgi:hypothetical protein